MLQRGSYFYILSDEILHFQVITVKPNTFLHGKPSFKAAVDFFVRVG